MLKVIFLSHNYLIMLMWQSQHYYINLYCHATNRGTLLKFVKKLYGFFCPKKKKKKELAE